jgi:hypothetical protein
MELEKGSIYWATEWFEKERAYARKEKTKPRYLLLPYRVHHQAQEEGDVWKASHRHLRYFP